MNDHDRHPPLLNQDPAPSAPSGSATVGVDNGAVRSPPIWIGAPILLMAGLAGSQIAVHAGVPLPYMIGGLMGSALAASAGYGLLKLRLSFPQRIRDLFIIVIGVAIGGTFTPAFLGMFGSFALTFSALAVFVLVSQAGNTWLFHRVGGYDRVTAFYCATPGGLVESIMMGEQAGGDVRLITVQHFLRIAMIIIIVPTLFLLWSGQSVGSASGTSFAADASQVSFADFILLTAAGLIGALAGRLLRIPAGMLIGSMIASAVLHVIGITTATPPNWLVTVSQLVLGVGLGGRFAGIELSVMLRSMGLALVSAVFMLSLAIAVCLLLVAVAPVPFEILLISFSPGGVTEMGLIALSLNADPVFVTSHHVFRIALAVAAMAVLARILPGIGPKAR